jgi:hypothetical protein
VTVRDGVNVAFVQGVQTPATQVAPQTFAAHTKRMRFAAQAPTPIAGLGSSNNVQLKKTGVVAGLEVRVYGDVIIGGTIGTTTTSYNWPYNLPATFKLTVNGQSTLIDAKGLEVKVNEYMANKNLDDRGVAQRIGSTTAIQQGTLSLSSEDWGGTGAAANFIAPGTNVAAIATYPIELTYFIPVASDQVALIGSIFGQSQATNINLEIAWSTQAQLFSAFGGAATLSVTGVNFDVTAIAYSIPVVNGVTVLPDLSMLHGLNSYQQAVTASGESEYLLPGTGAGRSLLRLYGNTYSGSVATPLAVTAANYTTISYKYGANDVPETVPNGSKMRAINERAYNTDIGKAWGFWCWDFASMFVLRDIIDLGSTSDFRAVLGLVATPTNGVVRLIQETLFATSVGA